MFDAEIGRGMKSTVLMTVLLAMLVLTCFLAWPDTDLAVSGWFYTPDKGFVLATHPFFLAAHLLAYDGARVLGVLFVVVGLLAVLRRKPVVGVNGKGWLFLLVALIVGPGLLANVVLKDHWGRARPRTITEFGGSSTFSSAWIPQQHGHKNDSFIAGDAAFGFFLTCFAYVVPRRHKCEKNNLSRRVFWGAVGVGALFGFTRIAMGAHFLSDVLFAAFFMLAIGAAIHAIMFGGSATAIYWRHWLFNDGKKEVISG